MSNWTQPVCIARWNQDYADPQGRLGMRRVMPLHLDVDGAGEPERCCYCGQVTRCGLYVRVDPATVPHPSP